MEFTEEQIAKAKKCRSAGELVAMAKAFGMEMSEGEARSYLEVLSFDGVELTDEELKGVSGGAKVVGGPQAHPVQRPKKK